MPILASAVRASDPFPATSVGAPEISVSGNFCATKLSAGKLILDRFDMFITLIKIGRDFAEIM